MTTNDSQAAVAAPASAKRAEIEDGATRVKFENDLARTQRALAAQPKVQVKVQEDTVVSVNGYQFQIKGKTKVQVPEQVARILEEAGRI